MLPRLKRNYRGPARLADISSFEEPTAHGLNAEYPQIARGDGDRFQPFSLIAASMDRHRRWPPHAHFAQASMVLADRLQVGERNRAQALTGFGVERHQHVQMMGVRVR
jgi:hypothetical protein